MRKKAEKIIRKIPGESHHHSMAAIFLGVAAIALSWLVMERSVLAQDLTTSATSTNTVTAPASIATPTVIATTAYCIYETGSWSDCASDGYQTRTIVRSPSGCKDTGDVPASKQGCTLPECTFTYGDWGECDSTNHQYRAVTSKSPSGCVVKTAPDQQRACSSEPSTQTVCTYVYNNWSACQSSGYQTRTIFSKIPNGCVDTAEKILKQPCAYAAPTASDSTAENSAPKISCAYNLSDWGACSASGYQTRTIISKTPVGCYETDPPKLELLCAYNANNPSGSTNGTDAKNSSATPYFNFLNLNGGEVVDGEVKLQGTVDGATSVEFYLTPIDSNNPKYLGLASATQQNTWEYALDSAQQPNGSFYISPRIKNAYGTYDGEKRLIIILNDINGSKIQDEASENAGTGNEPAGGIDSGWQKKYFKSYTCVDQNICGTDADPDQDGVANSEEFRLGTDPTAPDTDQDGFLDGDEIKNGYNPLKAAPGDKSDKMVFESPKEKGEIKKDIYRIEKVEMVDVEGKKNLKFSGKALPNTYVTIYIFSDPIVLTVKTDADGDWSYVLDKDIEDGEHQVYVAITDNTGKITAKSEAVAFVKTAEAASIVAPAEASAGERAVSPTRSWSSTGWYLFVALGLGALALAVSILGLIKHNLNRGSGTDPA